MLQKTCLLLCALAHSFIFVMEPQEALPAVVYDVWHATFPYLKNKRRNSVRATCKTLETLYSKNNVHLYGLNPQHLNQKQKNYALMLALYNNMPKVALKLSENGAHYKNILPNIDPDMLARYKPILKDYESEHSLTTSFKARPSITSLCIAAYFGDNKPLKMLLKKISDFSTEEIVNTNPLWYAVKNGHTETVNLLTKTKNRRVLVTGDVLLQALRHVTILSTLLSCVNPNRYTIKVHEYYRLPLFHFAARGNYHEAVSCLCNNKNININSIEGNLSFQKTPLALATENGHIKVVDILLAQQECLVDRGSHPPLFFACAHGYTKIVKYLLTAGADLNCLTKEGESCLYAAANHRHHKIMKILLKKDPSLNNVCTTLFNSPLHRTVFNGDVRGTTILLQSQDIEVNSVNHNSRTPLNVALKNKDEELIFLLQQHNAKTYAELYPIKSFFFPATS